MYSVVSTHLYHPLVDRWKHKPYSDAYREAIDNQYLPAAELRELSERKLVAAIEHAQRNSAFYGSRFARAGVRAQDLRTNGDLRRFPLTTKADVFEHVSEMLTDRATGQLERATTSGSTGIAMTFYVDSLHQAWVDASVWRGRSWWGLRRGDEHVVLWGRGVDSNPKTSLSAWLKFRLRNSLHFDTFQQFDDQRAREILASIRRVRPRLIYGYGSSLGALARHMADNGIVLAGPERPRVVEYTADHMYPPEKKEAERVFGTRVVSAYGLSEAGGVAQECREGRLHQSADHIYVEIVRANGEHADIGEAGEIVVTTLHNQGMPLIRYRTGDIGAWVNTTCICGIKLPVMRLEVGKAVDLITTSYKKAVSAHLLDYINLHLLGKRISGIRQFFVEQSAADEFQLSIVKHEPFDPRSVSLFVQKMKEYLGSEISVTPRFVDSIPLSPSGKRRYFSKTFQS